MKKIISLLLLLIFCAITFSQQIPAPDLKLRDQYLRKSKTQKIIGWVLIGGGSAIIIGTAISSSSSSSTSSSSDSWYNPDFSSFNNYAYAGGAIMAATGIVFLIMANNNKTKANEITAFMRLEKIPGTSNVLFKTKSFPAAGIRINLK